MRFKDKIAIVTAGSTGIGKAIVEEFALEGAKVIIANRSEDSGKIVTEELKKEGLQTDFMKTDISIESDVKNLVNWTIDKYGRIDILVNNAASFVLGSIDATVQDWNEILGVNIIGTATCSKHVSEHMKKAKSGNIINLSSISGLIAQPNQVTYNVTKAGIIEMTKCMALDLEPFNIRVNCISPGYIMTEGLEIDIKNRNMTQEDAIKKWGKKHIIKRFGKTREVARAVLFLASDDEASFITGENLMVDGGYTVF